MATPTTSYKRKFSEVSLDEYDKQSILDLCTSKLRYINPAQPPRRRTEVPLLRNVLIVNTMKHLSSDVNPEIERPMEMASEDLPVDPGHFEGLPPLSELLTDIMLDPHPSETPLAPLAVQPTMPSYMETDSLENEEKIVHNLLPCTSIHNIDSSQHSWDPSASSVDTFLTGSPAQDSVNPLDPVNTDPSFQSPASPLPSFISLFDSSSSGFSEPVSPSSYTDLTTSTSVSAYSYSSTIDSSASVPPQTFGALAEDLVGNTSLTEAELVYLAMEFSSKLPHLSFEELVQQALPYQQQTSQQSYYVPSAMQSCSNSANNSADANSATNISPSVDENMVRVLVDL